MSAVKHPLHLAIIITGMIGVIAGFWMASAFVGTTGLLIASIAAVQLARRLGLEPANDPAAPRQNKA